MESMGSGCTIVIGGVGGFLGMSWWFRGGSTPQLPYKGTWSREAGRDRLGPPARLTGGAESMYGNRDDSNIAKAPWATGS